MSRTFTVFAESDPLARSLLDELLRAKEDVEGYRRHMRELGSHLASVILSKLGNESAKNICVICSVEDADFLARGVVETLELSNLRATTRMMCLWNRRVRNDRVSISPVVRSYAEEFDRNDAVFIIVKSVISGACVVKTNLTKALTASEPKRVFVAAPVMLAGAEQRLAREFPDAVSAKFEFVHFATDTDKSPDGDEVLPGIGGSVYERLGLGDEAAKNGYVPEIVKERRRKAYPSLRTA
ncbi:hypothetical protein [Tahibacter soli]|jgi:hypothetical protein|uniref:Uracil phosphoribosyltransferase n=1 Tax=Tahibacter soli TaxID=2983605 RepID=A0A9X3YNG9_9GAMM|nr:hypothetical protein [Tahibacter soli]MDC8013936.1 hypothetical protein [Tahibacter soli]